MAAPIDVRAGLAAELARLVRDRGEWPIRDRRRFRNLLLDAVTSDAMPLAELLLRVHDDGVLRTFPDRSAPRAAWDAATARLAGDLQATRFVEPGVARFVAEAWATALGPVAVPTPTRPTPRPVTPLRAPVRSSANLPPRPAPPSPPPTFNAPPSPSAIKAYQQQNVLFLVVLIAISALAVIAVRSGGKRGATAPVTRTGPEQVRKPARFNVDEPPRAVRPAAAPAVAPVTPTDTARRTAIDSSTTGRAIPDSAPRVGRAAVAVAPARSRTTDDIVLSAGRVFEGRVLSIREQTVTVKDEDTGLEFEINKNDIDRVVTHDGRTLRFGTDNVPLLGSDDEIAAVSRAGRYRLRYAERWGTTLAECRDLARVFAPGTDLLVQHLRGAPMMRLSFVSGQGFNAAVRADGLFETGADVSPVRGPRGAFVSTRLSGRFRKDGTMTGVTRITAALQDGALVCDLALTVDGTQLAP